MELSRDDVMHVARLARLELTPEEVRLFQKQLSDILSHVEKLKELETSSVEPTSHAMPLQNVFREDEVRASLPREKVLQNAPDRAENFFRVPKIIE